MNYQGPALGGLQKTLLLNRLQRKTVYKDGCWLYTGGSKTQDGYRRIAIDRRIYGVHRLSLYIFKDLDLANTKLQANHRIECPNKECWNPEHLYAGTHEQNLADAKLLKQSHNSKKTHCLNGHEFNETNTLMLSSGKRQCRPCHANRTRLARKARR